MTKPQNPKIFDLPGTERDAPTDRFSQSISGLGGQVWNQTLTNWIGYAVCLTDGGLVKRFSATWTVPEPPATRDGQIIYLFCGLQPNVSGISPPILQTILQWGKAAKMPFPDDTGDRWTVRGIRIPTVATDRQVPPRPVEVGTTLTGVIELISAADDRPYRYRCYFANIDHTEFQTTFDVPLTDAVVVLEAYERTLSQLGDLPNRSYYPTTSVITFASLHIDATVNNGQHWTQRVPNGPSLRNISVVRDDITAGQIDFHFSPKNLIIADGSGVRTGDQPQLGDA